MPIEVTCQCGKRLKAKDELAGRTVKCPNCQQPLKIPASQAPAAPIAPTPVAPAGDGFADLFDDVGMTHQGGPTCPTCKAGVPEGAVICIHCGFNLETGQRLRTNIGSAAGDMDEPAGPVGHGGESGGSDAEAILAKAALTEDPEEDLDDNERYGNMGTAWIVGILMLAIVGGAFYGVYYYNMVYLPAHQPEEEEVEDF
jgi:hypothetical protein